MLFRYTLYSVSWMRGSHRRFIRFPSALRVQNGSVTGAIHTLHGHPGKVHSSPIVSNTLRGQLFRKTVAQELGGPCLTLRQLISPLCPCPSVLFSRVGRIANHSRLL